MPVALGVALNVRAAVEHRKVLAVAGAALVLTALSFYIPRFRPAAPADLFTWPTAAAGQTEWRRLRDLTDSLSIRQPSIGFIGGEATMTPPQIEHAWKRDRREASVIWLWRFEEQFELSKVRAKVSGIDVLMTAPVEAHDRDDRHTRELVSAMDHERRFSKPVALRLDGGAQVEVRFHCRWKPRDSSSGHTRLFSDCPTVGD